MNTILTLLLIAAVIGTVVMLVRGIIAFLQSTKLDLENPDDDARVGEMQAKQNKMMMNRIKFQALAVAIVALLILINR